MDLREYLFKKRISIKDFADTLGYSRTHLSLIVNDRASPSKRLALAIEKITKGEVTANELLAKQI